MSSKICRQCFLCKSAWDFTVLTYVRVKHQWAGVLYKLFFDFFDIGEVGSVLLIPFVLLSGEDCGHERKEYFG